MLLRASLALWTVRRRYKSTKSDGTFPVSCLLLQPVEKLAAPAHTESTNS